MEAIDRKKIHCNRLNETYMQRCSIFHKLQNVSVNATVIYFGTIVLTCVRGEGEEGGRGEGLGVCLFVSL